MPTAFKTSKLTSRFKMFWNLCQKFYQLVPTHFLTNQKRKRHLFALKAGNVSSYLWKMQFSLRTISSQCHYYPINFPLLFSSEANWEFSALSLLSCMEAGWGRNFDSRPTHTSPSVPNWRTNSIHILYIASSQEDLLFFITRGAL